MSESGYTHCPCCGFDTISDDMSEPELCSECEDAGCDPDGSEPLCSLDECIDCGGSTAEGTPDPHVCSSASPEDDERSYGPHGRP